MCWPQTLLGGYADATVQGFRPIRPNSQTMGHQFVKADCNKLTPTKAVSPSQYGLCSHASDMLANTTLPAINRKPRSMVIFMFLSSLGTSLQVYFDSDARS
jgi:hypothetical protein